MCTLASGKSWWPFYLTERNRCSLTYWNATINAHSTWKFRKHWSTPWNPKPQECSWMTSFCWTIMLATVASTTLQKFRWEALGHPPYSKDLAPCDFHIFGVLKKSDFSKSDCSKKSDHFRSPCCEWRGGRLGTIIVPYATENIFPWRHKPSCLTVGYCINSYGDYLWNNQLFIYFFLHLYRSPMTTVYCLLSHLSRFLWLPLIKL